jgi:uncharacterized protein YcgI (DUF1989 family)
MVSNINFFMSVPVLPDGCAGVVGGISQPGSYVELRAERDVLAILSNCTQTHNPCNGYNPTPIRVVIYSHLRHRRACKLPYDACAPYSWPINCSTA